MNQTHITYTTMAIAALIGVWLLFVSLPRWYESNDQPSAEGTSIDQRTALETTNVTLFYVSEDGMQLVGLERKIPHGDTTTEQARYITEAQLTAAPFPLASPIPEGATLRAIFVTERGDAFVDLSTEIRDEHSGGSLEELFTVYAIVNALTTNLPTISAVQILVEGREVDTLAGHVDLRRPLEKNLKWVEQEDSDDAA